MKKTILLLIMAFFCSNFAFGQNADSLKKSSKHTFSFDLAAFYTPVLSNDFYGLNMDFKYYLHPRIATGFSTSLTSKKMNTAFQYQIEKPILNYYEFGWINQYEIIQTKNIKVGLNLNNGIVVAELADNAITQKVFTGRVMVDKAKVVATNYFFLVQPGLDISIKLFSKKSHSPDIYLTTKAKYRFVFGDGKYGQVNDFSSHYFGMGITMVGCIEKCTK